MNLTWELSSSRKKEISWYGQTRKGQAVQEKDEGRHGADVGMRAGVEDSAALAEDLLKVRSLEQKTPKT